MLHPCDRRSVLSERVEMPLPWSEVNSAGRREGSCSPQGSRQRSVPTYSPANNRSRLKDAFCEAEEVGWQRRHSRRSNNSAQLLCNPSRLGRPPRFVSLDYVWVLTRVEKEEH